MSEPSSEPLTFNTLGNYQWPSMPADESIRGFGWQIWKRFKGTADDPSVSDPLLKWDNKKRLERITDAPACETVVTEMEATFGDWAKDKNPSRWLQLVVMPPIDINNVVRMWARSNGHHVIEPPPRELLLDRSAEVNVSFDYDASVVVIPQLERWFLRHQDGLCHVRKLLQHAAGAHRHCVIGCNSWAWQFLDKAICAGRLLPVGLVPNAFDAQRLQSWLIDAAEREGKGDHAFRLVESGDIVGSVYFAKLAARSLGIPLVAWQQWQLAIQTDPGKMQKKRETSPDEKTYWLSKFEEFHLPSDDADASLLTLHALLIHDGLTAEELDEVMPSVDGSNVLPSLQAARVIESQQGRCRCIPAAYPAIRSKLVDAGFSKDKL
ncbi:hypothetical protein [Novipirellula sp.]|uniref:hypothetical protein n=1 Tax=Novipirellula sp. TaxID=2795430 RepID=UPI00356B53AC